MTDVSVCATPGMVTWFVGTIEDFVWTPASETGMYHVLIRYVLVSATQCIEFCHAKVVELTKTLVCMTGGIQHGHVVISDLCVPNPDGLPFSCEPGRVFAREFTAIVPEEAGGLWLDVHGCPMLHCVTNKQIFDSLRKKLPALSEQGPKHLVAPSSFALKLIDDTKDVGTGPHVSFHAVSDA